MKKLIGLSSLIVVFINFQLNAFPKEYSIENNLFKKVFSFEGNKIIVSSLLDNLNKNELLQTSNHKPYFEFIINNCLVTSNDALWQFEDINTRKMANGGTEVTLMFSGLKNLKDLKLSILQQYFPNSTLVREQLLLRSKSTTLRLNKENNKLHFVFPQYSFKNNNLTDSISEIRMASFGNEILPELDTKRTYDNRIQDRNLAACHMFHTSTISHALSVGGNVIVKGPFDISKLDKYTIISTYEHASQDGIKGLRSKEMGNNSDFGSMIDAQQGVNNNIGFKLKDEDFFFIGINHQKDKSSTTISNKILRGGYLDNELIPMVDDYKTVWNSTAFVDRNTDPKKIIHNYLLNQITEHKLSREPGFYYNTWGMQRNVQQNGKNMREVFTESRILEEMEYASQLNIDYFVLDDGWQEKLGQWEYNKNRLPNGLKPFVDKATEKNMKLGVWFSLIGIDTTTQRYKDHPEWVIRSLDGTPAIGQWNNPVFDIVSDFSKSIVEDHKKLIDQGVRFFKWDAINMFNSAQPNLWHGDSTYDRKEIIDRYNYLLPFVVTSCMKQLGEYNHDVIIEIDVTEPERCMIGLMPLQEGKFFWMNNGASGYGDYSTFRTKSMRTIINQLGDIFPPELFTYAQYPQNIAPFYAQRYNINTSLIAGNGFWGDLKMMSIKDRETVGNSVSKAKIVFPYIAGKPLKIIGKIGDSPEMYEQVDSLNSFGQVVGFSGSAKSYLHSVKLNPQNLLCALNQSYYLEGDLLNFNFQFTIPDDTREAFIIGNYGKGISVIKSTGWIDNVKLEENKLNIKLGAESMLTIKMPLDANNIKVNTDKFQFEKNGLLLVYTSNNQREITITWDNIKPNSILSKNAQ